MEYEQIIRCSNLTNKINKINNGCKIMKNLQQLKKNGLNNNEINTIIQKLKLPLKIHLFITANFSDLMELKYI